MQKRHPQANPFLFLKSSLTLFVKVWRFCFEFLLYLGGAIVDRSLDTIATVLRLPRRPYLNPSLRFPLSLLQRWWFAIRIRQARQRSRRKRWWNNHFSLAQLDRFFGQFRIRPSQWRKWGRLGASSLLSFLLVLTQTIFINLIFLQPAQAVTTLAIEPITWDFVGLDSNKPETQGPETYIVGARVCNTGSEPARNVEVQFRKDGIDNGYTFIRLTGGDTYYTESISVDDGSEAIPVGSYVFDTRSNGALAKSKYALPSTPQYCQDYYYNFKVDRTPAAWNTYQRYFITAKADNASQVSTERPRQIYIEKLISQARNEVYFFGCDPNGGTSYSATATVEVGDVFTCEARAHTSTAYPQLSFTADIPNVIFQILDVQSTYSNPGGGINSTVYADACGWVNDPRDPRYHLSPSACSSDIISGLNVYSDQYPYLAPPAEGNGGVGNNVVTRYKIKVIGFPDGAQITNPIQVSNVILDFSGSSFHYNADYGQAPNIVNITVDQPSATDLSVVKSHSGNFGYGANTYTLTVSDAADANNADAKSPVTLTDTLPTGYTFVDQDSTKPGIQPLTLGGNADNWDCYTSDSDRVLNCVYDLDTNLTSDGNDGDGIPDSFPNNTTQNLTLNINIADGAVPSGTTSTNFVRVDLGPNQTDSNPNNNASSDPTTLLPNADLAIVKTLSDGDTTIGGNQTSFVVGREGIYNLQVTNLGNLDAVTPTVTDTLPNELEFVSATGTNWTCSTDPQNAQVVRCNSSVNLSSVVPNNTTSISLRVRVRETNNVNTTNPAIVSSPTYDSDTSNNNSSITTPITRPAPDLNISKTPSPSTLILNKNSNFTLTVNNVGSDATSGLITVNEAFPAGFGMQYVSHSGTGWSCIFTDTGTSTTRPCQSGDTTGGTQSINFYNSGPLAAGASSTITLTVKATLDPGTTVNNTVTVSTPGDTFPGNNTATAAVNIGTPDLAIVKSHAEPLLLNASNNYTITVTNKTGSATTTGPIIVTENFPTTDFTYVSHSGEGWSCIFESTGTITVSPRACQSGDGTGVLSGTTRTMKFYNAGPLAANQSSSFTLTVNPGATAITTPVNNTVIVDTEGEPSTSSTYTDNTYNDPTTADNSTATGRRLAVEKRLTRVSTSQLTVNSTTPTVVGYSDTPTATQCSPAIGLAGSTDADDFSGTGNNLAINRTTTPVDSRKYTCPALSAGDWIQYKMAIASNETNASAKGTQIAFSDTIPSIITNVSWQCTAPEPNAGAGTDTNSCNGATSSSLSGTGNNINLNNISLKRIATGQNAGVTGYVLITVVGQMSPTATAAQLANITNTASTPEDADPFNNAWAVQHGTGTPPSPPDLTITKAPASQSISNYQQHTFTITPSNISNASSQRITVTDTLPSGLDFVSASGTGWTCSYANQILTCFTDNVIAAGTAGTPTDGDPITVAVEANSAAALPITLTNLVSISTPNETVLTNNNASATVTITAPVLPNLTVSKTDGGATFTQGVNGTYTLTVNNTGSVATTQPITVTDTLPTGLTYFSATGTNWTCSNTGQIVLCNTTQTIAAGASASTITVTVTPTIGTGTVTNNVRVDTTANAETTTADNTASDTTPLQDSSVDLQLTKTTWNSDGTATVTGFQVGQPYRYRLTVTNNTTTKPALAPITITDQLPAGLTYLYSVSNDGFTCAATGQTVTCNRPTNLAASATAVVDLAVQVSGTASGSLTNEARVTSTSDPCADFTCTGGTADNNRANISTSVSTLADLAITKTAVDQDSGITGNQFYDANPGTYTITVTNNGPSNYTGAVLVNEDLANIASTDLTDPNFTYISHSGSDWICTQFGTANPCVTGDKNLQFSKTGLQAGESSTLTLTVNVPNGTAVNTYTNTVSINAATLTAANDTVNTNDSDTADIEIVDNVTTFSIEKDDDDGTGEPTSSTLQTQFVKGGVGQYTILVTNEGSVAAPAPVTITDTFPTGLTYAGYPQLADWECTGAIGGPSVSCIYGEWNTGFTSFTQRDFPAGLTSGVAIDVNVADATPPTTSTLSGGVYTDLTTNTASVSGSNFTTLNASEDTAIIQPADLQVTKTLDTDGDGTADTNLLAANTTGQARYSLTVQNNGPGTSYAPIYLQDYLPTGVTYNSNITLPAGWTFRGYNSASNEVSYVYSSDLASGANAGTIVMAVNVASDAPGNTINLARVDGFTPEPDYDLTTPGYQNPQFAVCDRFFTTQPVNNCVTLERGVSGGVSTDLEVIKIDDTPSDVNGADDDLDSVPFNTSFTYIIRVQNNGTTDADSVNLSDSIPEGLNFVSVTIDAGDTTSINPYGTGDVTRVCSFDNLADRLNCNLYKVSTAEGSSDPIDITVTVTPVLSGTIPNTAVVTSTTADSNIANNSESEETIVTGGAGNTISGTVFIDKNDNGVYNAGTDTPDQDITVRLYRDANNDNAIDANDVLLATTSSAVDGTYSFVTSLTGNFVVAVDITDGDLPSNATWTTAQVLDATLGASDTGNDFGYKTPPGSLLFVKRITAVNGTAITGFEDDTTSPKNTEDNDALWPDGDAQYLRGAIGDRTAAPNNVPVNVEPGQQVEYTVYFLSSGGSPVRDVKFCDLIPANMTYVSNSIELGYNTGVLADPNGSGTALSDANDGAEGALGEQGIFYAAGINTPTLPSVCVTSNANPGDDNNSSTNDTGAVFVQIVDSGNNMPYATAAGTPAGSYGFVRFRATVD